MRVFVEECSSPERCRPVVQGLQQAIAAAEAWSFTRNAVTVSFDPTTQTITAAFAFDNTFDPPEQTMPAAQFLALMTTWLIALGSSEGSQT